MINAAEVELLTDAHYLTVYIYREIKKIKYKKAIKREGLCQCMFHFVYNN